MKGYIYKIFCKNENIKECYIGSTVNFTLRKRSHIDRCKRNDDREFNKKIYSFIRQNGNFENFDFEILEIIDFNERIELNKKEHEWIIKTENNLNQIKPSMFKSKKEYDKEYNKHNFNERQQRQSKQIICDICKRLFRYDSKWRHEKTKIHIKHLS